MTNAERHDGRLVVGGTVALQRHPIPPQGLTRGQLYFWSPARLQHPHSTSADDDCRARGQARQGAGWGGEGARGACDAAVGLSWRGQDHAAEAPAREQAGAQDRRHRQRRGRGQHRQEPVVDQGGGQRGLGRAAGCD
eukprot:scaffold17961_cov146-Isochrysis_galbana.AAC.2